MVGTHGLTERLNSIIIKITYIYKNTHIARLVNSALYTTYLSHIIAYKTAGHQ